MPLSYRHEEGVAEIQFDDGKANVMSTAWFRELGGLLDRAEKDEARAVLFRGRAGMFSAGLDMKWLPTLKGDAARELVETFSAHDAPGLGLPDPDRRRGRAATRWPAAACWPRPATCASPSTARSASR